MDLAQLKTEIDAAWDDRDAVNASTKGAVRDAVATALALLDLGTARNPASRKRASSQPLNFGGTLSHHTDSPLPSKMVPLGMVCMSFRRNDKSTAFFSH